MSLMGRFCSSLCTLSRWLPFVFHKENELSDRNLTPSVRFTCLPASAPNSCLSSSFTEKMSFFASKTQTSTSASFFLLQLSPKPYSIGVSSFSWIFNLDFSFSPDLSTKSSMLRSLTLKKREGGRGGDSKGGREGEMREREILNFDPTAPSSDFIFSVSLILADTLKKQKRKTKHVWSLSLPLPNSFQFGT